MLRALESNPFRQTDVGIAYLNINNFDVISKVYGAAIAERATADVIAILNANLAASGVVERVHSQSLRITLWDFDWIPRGTTLCTHLLSKIAFRSCQIDEHEFFLSISATDRTAGSNVPQSTEYSFIVAPTSQAAIDQVANNMADAVCILRAILLGQLQLLLVPLCGDLDRQYSVAYEVDARIVSENGALRRIELWRPLFEELGLVHILDYHIVTAVAAKMQADTSLSATVYVSPSSLRSREWGRILESIVCNEAISTRITVGITRSIYYKRTEVSLQAIDRIRESGASIAIDGFKHDFQAVRDLMVLQPDTVKMDAIWVRQRAGQVALLEWTKIAQEVARNVVIDCFDSRNQLRSAFNSDSIWEGIKMAQGV